MPSSRRNHVRYVAGIVFLAAIYFFSARLGLMMDAVSGFATLVWPPTGISLAALLVFGRRFWPGVWLGAFFANLYVGAPAVVACGIATGNTLEALLATYALHRFAKLDYSLGRIRDVLSFIVLAAFLSTMVSATIGVLSLVLGGVTPAARLGETWQAWWLGDMIGDLVLASLVLTWRRRPSLRVSATRWIEGVGLIAVVVMVSLSIFFGWHPSRPSPYRQVYTLVLPLLWAAFRFGQRGVTAMICLVSAIAIWGTAAGSGPFADPTLHERLTALQVFMSIVAVANLVLGAAVSERNDATEKYAELLVREQAARRQAEEAVRARDEFLSIAAHEFKTPLSVLGIQIQNLERVGREGGLARLPSERAEKSLGMLLRQVRRLDKLVDNLLDLARLVSGTLRLDLEEVDLSALTLDTVAGLRDEAARAGSSLALDAEAPAIGRWDRVRLGQIITNLLSNAIKYGEGKPIDVKVDAGATSTRLVVCDQGVGIAPGDLGRIFSRFERVAPAGHVGGLGLGLYITRQIVEAHGGSIRVESRLDRGSKFTVELPSGEQTRAR